MLGLWHAFVTFSVLDLPLWMMSIKIADEKQNATKIPPVKNLMHDKNQLSDRLTAEARSKVAQAREVGL